MGAELLGLRHARAAEAIGDGHERFARLGVAPVLAEERVVDEIGPGGGRALEPLAREIVRERLRLGRERGDLRGRTVIVAAGAVGAALAEEFWLLLAAEMRVWMLLGICSSNRPNMPSARKTNSPPHQSWR